MFREKLLKLGDWQTSPDGEGRYGTIEELKEFLLYKRIAEWTPDYLKLEDGTKITLGLSESDCCAHAGGEFNDVELDAVITNLDISEIIKSDDEYGYIENKSTVTLFHNQNPIAQADMEAGHNGYYYSVGSLVINDIHFPVIES